MSFGRGSGKNPLPFGLDPSDLASSDQNTSTPALEFPVNSPLVPRETDAAQQAMAFSRLLANGPFFTGNVEGADGEHAGVQSDGIQRHSDKYKPVKKIGRTVEEHPYLLEFFPDELYLAMGVTRNSQKRLLSLSAYKKNGGLAEFAAPSQLDTLKDMADNLEETDASIAEGEEEEVDDEFEEDDDDDYNAEKYFNDGDDDFADDGEDEAAF